MTGTEYTDYVYDILDILKSRKNLEDYIYNDMFLGALGLGPSEWAKREISALCESIEKAYETIDVYQQGKGKRDRITFARKGPFLLVLRDGPCGGFREHGVSAGRMEKRAVQHKYYENDYLCYVRVVTDADEEVLEHNDYSGFSQRLESSTGSANRYRYNGKEEQVTGNVGLTDYGARFYDNLLPRWTTRIYWRRNTTATRRMPSAITIR